MSYQTDVQIPCAEAQRAVRITPDFAIVISRASSGAHQIDNRIAPIVTTHHISAADREAKPQIGPGTVVSAATVKGIFAELGMQQPMTFHDDLVLATGSDGFMWHQPPRAAHMHWLIGSKPARLLVRWPHLLFNVTTTEGLRVYAIAPKGRPKISDPLYRAPLGNIYDNATLCWGSIQQPERSITHRQQFEDAIYATNFTHANAVVLSRAAKIADDQHQRQDLFAYWKARSGNRPSAVPLSHLVTTKLRIGDLL